MKAENGIKKFRERMRWNQSDLAKILGKKQQNVSDWEAGINPGLPVIKKLFELEATVEELFDVDYNKIQGLVKIEATNNLLLQQMMQTQLEILNRLNTLEGKKEPLVKARMG